MTPTPADGYPPVGLAQVALRGRCPRCGKGRLFESWLKVTEHCDACSLSFAEHEEGDGPAFVGILVVGALAGIGAAVMEVKLEPAFWVHAVVWVPFVVIASLLALRGAKAALIGVQYHLRKHDFE